MIAITHLPQVAALGRTHLVVEKLESGSSVRVRRLSRGERIEEVARMLAGPEVGRAPVITPASCSKASRGECARRLERRKTPERSPEGPEDVPIRFTPGHARRRARRGADAGFRIETWGCQMNVHDSEKMAAALGSVGLRPEGSPGVAPEVPEVVVLNTCSVREKGAEKVFTRVAQLVRDPRRPRFIGVAGCVAQQEGAAIFGRSPAVDFVLGTGSLVLLPEVVRRLRGGRIADRRDRTAPGNLDIPPEQIERVPGIKAYITVMEGCDNFCSFCVVPFTGAGSAAARWPMWLRRRSRSPPPASAKSSSSGRRELLPGSRGRDGFRRSRARCGPRLRDPTGPLTSPHPRDFDDALMEAFADGGPLAPSMHLPAQSGATSVLERMRRGYSREDFLRSCAGRVAPPPRFLSRPT